MCEQLMQKEHLFRTYFLEDFASLCSDRVINVRMTMAQVILRSYRREVSLLHCNEMQ